MIVSVSMVIEVLVFPFMYCQFNMIFVLLEDQGLPGEDFVKLKKKKKIMCIEN